VLKRPTGIYDRQAAIGLDIPQWAYVAVIAPSGVGFEAAVRAAIQEAGVPLAEIGVEGITIVLRNAGTDPGGSDAARMGATRVLEQIRSRRPWFSAVIGNEQFYLENRKVQAAAGVFLVVGGEPRVIADSDVPVIPHQSRWVVADLANGLVSVNSSPAAVSRLAHDAMSPDDIAADTTDPVQYAAQRHMTMLLALNALVKPSRFAGKSFLATKEVMETMTASAINTLGIRPRFKKDPANEFSVDIESSVPYHQNPDGTYATTSPSAG